MAAVVGWQIDAVCLVVGGDDDAATIEDTVLAQVLFVDAQHIRRRCRIGFHVVVPSVAIDLTEIAGFVDAQHPALRKPLNRPSMCDGMTSMKFHGPTACLTGSSSVSLPVPCLPPRTNAWLIFSAGRCTRWAR